VRLILTHNDLDGLTSLLLTQFYFKETCSLNYYKIVDYKELYIGDEFDDSWFNEVSY